jgi:hypothetical protein
LASFFIDFLSSTLAEVVGGGLVAVLLYFLIERRLRLNEERSRRAQVAAAVLSALRRELAHNGRVAEALREHLPRGDLPYERFETSGWALVSQVGGLTALDSATVRVLLDAYPRIRSANDQHELLVDLTYGATGAVTFVIARSSERGRETFQRLDERRADLRGRLLRRVEELEPVLRDAIARVDAELERHAPRP